jgi:Flp pilus assembly protein TadD
MAGPGQLAPGVRATGARGVRLLAVALCFAALAGCVGYGDVTGSISGATPSSPDALKAYSDEWGHKWEADHSDKAAAIHYAQALRAQTRFAQAVAVLETAAIKSPTDLDVLAAYGKALADNGQFEEADQVLSRAHTPEHPSWSVLSAQGSIADQMGNHARARDLYQAALKINPGEPAIQSNLGLSYALDKNLSLAESTLREAVANPRADARIRQNLALVLALQGKFPEAEEVSRHDLAPADAAANVAAIRQMIAQSNTWRDIAKLKHAKG